MSIRLNKAIRELNIGLQTAVEFLKKKSDLGEVRDDLSFKLQRCPVQRLGGRVQVGQGGEEKRPRSLFPKHQKEKKRSEGGAKSAGVAKPSSPQKYTVLGKIDLDSIGKKPSHAVRNETPQGQGRASRPTSRSRPSRRMPQNRRRNRSRSRPQDRSVRP